MLAGNEVIEKYRFQWRNREACLEKASVLLLTSKRKLNIERCINECNAEAGKKLNETTADLGRSDAPLGLWSLIFFFQVPRLKENLLNRTGL